MDQFFSWMDANRDWLGWVGAGSLIMLILSLIIVPILVVRMQPDYFMENRDKASSMQVKHPVLGFFGKLLKNLAGGLLVIGGILLSLPLIPGQGLLTILIGLAVMDFPGKRRLELWIIKMKPVNWAIQKLRAKADQPPLNLPS
ncbi:MAG: hypothetical protein P1U89_23360 [Verrucomicrobiales bacterium]|nr:hypothetical protein [Verrucomicrobiales bacterium]